MPSKIVINNGGIFFNFQLDFERSEMACFRVNYGRNNIQTIAVKKEGSMAVV